MEKLALKLEPYFELGGSGRLLAMEGIRGIAVVLVFLQHYCGQFKYLSDVFGISLAIVGFFLNIGNFGVELFFVLSGYLIYKTLIRKSPTFLSFMGRRAQRLYPAFFVAFVIGVALDAFRPTPNIPPEMPDALVYLAANLAFLPGLFPIQALFAVNWSLSYEWWFYTAAVILVSVLQFSAVPARIRIAGILILAGSLVALSAAGVDGVPIRGLCIFAGMLLVEIEILSIKSPRQITGLALPVLALAAVGVFKFPTWLVAVILFGGFLTFVWTALAGGRVTDMILCNRYLRWFGNISYSYYLVHAFVVVIASHVVLPRVPSGYENLAFWIGIGPVFVASLVAGALLFVFVERRYSLGKSVAVIPAKIA